MRFTGSGPFPSCKSTTASKPHVDLSEVYRPWGQASFGHGREFERGQSGIAGARRAGRGSRVRSRGAPLPWGGARGAVPGRGVAGGGLCQNTRFRGRTQPKHAASRRPIGCPVGAGGNGPAGAAGGSDRRADTVASSCSASGSRGWAVVGRKGLRGAFLGPADPVRPRRAGAGVPESAFRGPGA